MGNNCTPVVPISHDEAVKQLTGFSDKIYNAWYSGFTELNGGNIPNDLLAIVSQAAKHAIDANYKASALASLYNDTVASEFSDVLACKPKDRSSILSAKSKIGEARRTLELALDGLINKTVIAFEKFEGLKDIPTTNIFINDAKEILENVLQFYNAKIVTLFPEYQNFVDGGSGGGIDMSVKIVIFVLALVLILLFCKVVLNTDFVGSTIISVLVSMGYHYVVTG